MNLSQVRDQRFRKKWQASGAFGTYTMAETRLIAEMRKSNPTLAVVRKIAGQVVLDDPVADEVVRTVGKHNCRGTLDLNADRVTYFQGRMAERGFSSDEVVIVLVNADDPNGGPLANVLMPGHDWQLYRDQGQVPFARGLVSRPYIGEVLSMLDKPAAEKLIAMPGKTAVVVVDHGVAEIFEAQPQ